MAYYRVPTRAQGDSGLGLDAQKASVAGFVKGSDHRAVIVAEFTEVESGKNNQRVQLASAIDRAKKEGAVLVIAKLDRNGCPAAKSECVVCLHAPGFGGQLSVC